jgi:hypothetical protein
MPKNRPKPPPADTAQIEIAAFVETSKVLTEPGDQLKKHEDIREILDKAIAELKAATNGQNPKE